MFIWRLFSSVILLVIFLSAFLLKNHFGLSIFIFAGVALSILCTLELSRMLRELKLEVLKSATVAFSIMFFASIIIEKIYLVDSDISMIVLSLFAIYCWFKILFSKFDKVIISRCGASALVILSVIVPLNCLTLIYLTDYGVNYYGMSIALFLIIITKSGDIGAYCVGTITSKRSSGNHKIVPNISPKKSWEGAAGGLIISVILCVILYYSLGLSKFITNNFLLVVCIGIILYIGGFIGDLSESVLKRITGIKDSGSIIPGIGGALDLTDSLFINAPLFYILLKLSAVV